MAEERVFLALGANLGSPADQLADAVTRLIHDELRVVSRSRLYRSAPVGPPGQPDYVNAAVEVRTTFSPDQLLAHTQGVENAMGRVKAIRWGPRLVDIDIALYGQRQVNQPELIIPHRELVRRRFVLAPLVDIDPTLVVAGVGKTVSVLLSELDDDPEDLSVLSTDF
ncbi:MAG: 2-amino-4-hydroxy-6-hydroxymethyldihydropteridine diphosphokinase [Myxococcota bacterium]